MEITSQSLHSECELEGSECYMYGMLRAYIIWHMHYPVYGILI